jgi:hypothetical protein
MKRHHTITCALEDVQGIVLSALVGRGPRGSRSGLRLVVSCHIIRCLTETQRPQGRCRHRPYVRHR